MGTDNAFAELGLACDATEREVKAAWRRLASQWHPDRNGSADAVARMQRINQAFEAIRNAGFPARPGARAGRRGRAHAAAAAAEDAGRTRRRPIHRKVKLTLEEAAAGSIKSLRGRIDPRLRQLRRRRPPGAGRQLRAVRRLGRGGEALLLRLARRHERVRRLPRRRHRPAKPARTARAPARRHAAYQLKVRIPPGVRHGDLLHVDGRRARANPPPADLELRVELLAHPFFELDDDGTLRCEMPVDGFAWIANRTIQLPTLAGLRSLALRRDRLTYRLPGEGYPTGRSGARGDQVVTVQPLFPEQLSADQEILLDQLIAIVVGPRRRGAGRAPAGLEPGPAGLGARAGCARPAQRPGLIGIGALPVRAASRASPARSARRGSPGARSRSVPAPAASPTCRAAGPRRIR